MSIYYWLGVDWSGGGSSSDYVDEAGRVLKYTIDRGRDSVIGAEGGGFERQSPGRMLLELDNWDGRYDPWNSSGELYGNLMPGKRVRFISDAYSSTNTDNQVTFTQNIVADSASVGTFGFGADAFGSLWGAYGIGYINNFVIGMDPNVINWMPFLRFDTSEIPGTGNISGVTMTLTPFVIASTSIDYEIVKNNWAGFYPLATTDVSIIRDAREQSQFCAQDAVWAASTSLTTDVPHTSPALDTNWIRTNGFTYYSLSTPRSRLGLYIVPTTNEYIEIYTSTDDDASFRPTLNVSYTYSGMLFTGFITDIQTNGFRGTATITVEDGAAWLERRTPNISLMTSTDTGGIISEILTEVSYPFSTNIDAGVDTVDYFWTSERNALDEIHDLATSELGRFCVEANGTARFINRHSSEPVAHTLTEDEIGRNIHLPVPWEYMRTIVKVNSYPRVTGSSDSVLWTLRDAVKVTTDADQEIWADYNYENEDVPALDAFLGTYKATIDGTTDGTDKTADFDLTLTAFDRSAKIAIANNGASNAYLVDLELQGTPITSPDPITVMQETTDAALPTEFIFDYPWLSSVNTAKDFLGVLYNHLSTARVYPVITLYQRPETAFTIELEERLHLTLDTYGINQDFYVSKITHESGSTPQEVVTRLYLYPPVAGVSNADTLYLVLGSADYGLLDTNKLGF